MISKRNYEVFPILIIITLFLLSLLSVSNSWAVGNIHIGLIEIHPGFGVKQTYRRLVDEDNPGLGGDWITTFSSGLQLKWPLLQHTIKANWRFDLPRYAKNTKWNSEEYQLRTDGNFVFGRGGRQFTLALGHRLVKSDEPAELGQYRQERKENRFISKLEINLKKNVRLDFSHEFRSYWYENGFDNRDENYLQTAINVRIMPKTTAFVSLWRSWSNYKESKWDSSSWRVGPGLRWDATAKLSGQISAGFWWRDYEKRNNINNWVIMVDLTHKMSDFTKLSFGLERGEREYSWLPKDETIERFDNYLLQQIKISLNHQLTYKIWATSGFIYEDDDYDELKRSDQIYVWRFGLKYQIQEWLSVESGFEQRHLGSSGSKKRSSYLNNIFSFSIGLAL